MSEIIVAPQLEFIYSPIVNFAMQQNHVPVIRKLAIKNNTETELNDLFIQINSEPDFALVWQSRIDNIPPNGFVELTAINLKLSPKYLSEVTERITGHFSVIISASEQQLLHQAFDISILPFDHWNGIAVLPEMINAFITPNHPEISRIILRASSILEKWTGSPSFDEYQTQNPDRIKKQMAAVYEAIAELKLVYCSVPASFEQSGQRVRMVDTIATQGIANCLDLSLLYASCLEAIGIYPLIVIIKGHAFSGAWLIKETFPDTANDDLSLLSKKMADGINEIILLESTCMNAGHSLTFDDAVKSGENHLIKEDEFLLFVDIKRGRFSGIRPLPLRVQTTNGWEIVQQVHTERNTHAPEEITASVKVENVQSIEISKQRLWERKLLDLSLRNNLLNLRITKSTIQLIPVKLNQLEDALAGGAEFQILPKPADWDNPLRNSGLYQSLNQSDPVIDLVKHEFSQKRLRSYLPEAELNISIINLYRSAKLSLEENGANTLYIALGILKWFETGISEKPRFAPILLVPVDIIKKSAQKGYIIRSREEETMMNITLLEMLRQDFGINIGGLETLPKDESGIDVRAVFSIIRQAIMTQNRWDLEEQAFIGTFSFSKFIMWNDIHNNADKLARNKIVASLISGKMEWKPSNLELTENLDKLLHPSDIALPISTDSSQLQAIHAAVKEHSFILHGPPGTGKSQTITNIIANALYNGKKVLFVAEKMAALQVVQNRLESIGLGPFCLELHSNKSKKSAVLEQLKCVTEITKKSPSSYFKSEAERLHLLRMELSNYVDELHKKYNFGFSLYDAISGYIANSHVPGSVEFKSFQIESLTTEKLTLWQDLAEELEASGKIIKHPKDHPLTGIRLKDYNQQVKTDARQLLSALSDQVKQLIQASAIFIDVLKIDLPPSTPEQFHCLKIIAELILRLPDTPAPLLKADNFSQAMSDVQDFVIHGKKREELRNLLLKKVNNSGLTFAAAEALQEWNKASAKWFLPKWIKQNAIKKSINSFSLSKLSNEDIVPLLETLINYQQENQTLLANTSVINILGFLWKNENTDWKAIQEISESLIQLNRQAVLLFNNAQKAQEWRSKLSNEWNQGSGEFGMLHKTSIQNFIAAFEAVRTTEQKIKSLLIVDTATSKETTDNWLELLNTHALKWLENIEQLRDWSNWNQLREKAIHSGLDPFVASYEVGEFNSSQVLIAFNKGLYKSCAGFIFNSSPQLATFNGQLFEEKIKKFREISKTFETLTKEELYAKLASKIPSLTQEASQSSEISILQRAIRNNGRGISIRKLFDSIPHLLPRLHPCMLMSPISVAQYFDAATTKFDLVVFDEASQMPTCEAIGAMARGENVIVVGDPKQMPPTSFFSSTQFDEDNAEKEDLESILDDCLALSMPSSHLLWHYRSKHESLIAFSNAKYYENKLLTFPSPDDIDSKVKFVPVQGFYDRGKTKQNKAEAKAIIDEIIRRLTDPELSKKSIGVVTFSSVQQILIDDMLNEVWRNRPDLELIASDSKEPIFIKNLENVQGDERDVILFSVGYGPDLEGKVSLNFGPVNRNGGWRRLNVAVSRARYEMKVFSTLSADQIDITRTASEGVASLKAFLEYAEKGKTVLQTRHINGSSKVTAMINRLSEEIKCHGYKVHTNIGCSGYKIDLGIVHPEKPDRYLLGILCDGHNYKSAKTSRDREIVQVDVLRLLGWNIHRVWSLEWWENADSVLKGILEAIENAKTIISEEPVPAPLETIPFSEIINEDFIAMATPAAETTAITAANKDQLDYEIAVLELVRTSSSDDFMQYSNRHKILSQLKEVIEKESPISKNLLIKRVLAAWGISRAGSRLNAQFEILLPELNLKKSSTNGITFYWHKEHDPLSFNWYRVPKNLLYKREAEDLPKEEVANAVRAVLINQISLTKNELMRETAKLFGFSRTGSNVEQAMLHGIDYALQRGFAEEKEARIVLHSKLETL